MRDMTSGEPYGHLWRYALPLLLGNWLQLAYNAVDSIIAGRFIGQNALAAEGIAAPVMNLVILAISGMCIGSGVLMSEHFGAKDYGKLKRTMSTMLLFGGSVWQWPDSDLSSRRRSCALWKCRKRSSISR